MLGPLSAIDSGADPWALAEAEKYRQVWAHKSYRVHSPGWRHKELAWERLGCGAGERLTDYGCGTGRAALWFADRGLDVTAVDLVVEALDPSPGARLRFVEACLWALPGQLPPTDWAYCTDVLEHLPMPMVGPALVEIELRTKRALFASIACFADSFGGLVGQPLHLTIRPPDWWITTLASVFETVEVVRQSRVELLVVAKPFP